MENYFDALKSLYLQTMNRDILNFWLYSKQNNVVLTLEPKQDENNLQL